MASRGPSHSQIATSQPSTPSSPRLRQEPQLTLPLPRIRATPPPLAPAPSSVHKRPAKLVRRHSALQQLDNILQQLSIPPKSSSTNVTHYPDSPSTPRALEPERPDSLPYTYHIYDRSRKPFHLHSQNQQYRNRTETLFRKANQLAHAKNTEVYVVVQHSGHFMVFNSANPTSPSPLEPKDNEAVITVQIS